MTPELSARRRPFDASFDPSSDPSQIPRFDSSRLANTYRKCLLSRRNAGKPERAPGSDFTTTVQGPPAALTGIISPASLLKRMVPSPLQDPPFSPPLASQSDCVGPPLAAMIFSLRSA